MSKYVLYCDGSITKNPGGKMTAMFMIFENGKEIENKRISCGIGTNNIAEFLGLIHGLKYCHEHHFLAPKVFIDSQFVARCVHGRYKLKKEHLKPFLKQSRLFMKLLKATLIWVPNTQNLVDLHKT